MSSGVVLDEYVSKITMRNAVVLEEHIKLVVRPKPRFIPTSLWFWLLQHIIAVERHPRVK